MKKFLSISNNLFKFFWHHEYGFTHHAKSPYSCYRRMTKTSCLRWRSWMFPTIVNLEFCQCIFKHSCNIGLWYEFILINYKLQFFNLYSLLEVFFSQIYYALDLIFDSPSQYVVFLIKMNVNLCFLNNHFEFIIRNNELKDLYKKTSVFN